ncbi:hypothetical protein [Kitasatospora kifunensis]|uniref:Uncharacterized protein n=1 Tax=Kitasatospora kifunensis TaxID=58351 RepID=A0A7W7RB61_KITKI|nr:hypothetical protein [Kitasatospora kifunensis]MBB4928463.1 hypothetical protein [Kitasatospora kifunensis]
MWIVHADNLPSHLLLGAGAVHMALGLAPRLEQAATMTSADTFIRLTTVPGIGNWTAPGKSGRAVAVRRRGGDREHASRESPVR